MISKKKIIKRGGGISKRYDKMTVIRIVLGLVIKYNENEDKNKEEGGKIEKVREIKDS